MSLGIRVEINGQEGGVQCRETNCFPQFYVPPQVGGFTSPDTSGFVLPGNFSGTAPVEFLVRIQPCWIIPFSGIQKPVWGSLGSHSLRRTLLFGEDMASTPTAPALRVMAYYWL